MEVDAESRAQLREEHIEAFDLAENIAHTIAGAVIRPLTLHNDVARALDILMQQAWKAHSSVIVLCERLYIEDAAAITRRLLELSVQGAYILTPKAPEDRLDRARRLLAKLWQSSPEELRAMLPPEDRRAWETWFDSCKVSLPEKPKSWWPTFKDLFDAIGVPDAYEMDYRFLSGVAHGFSSFLTFDYAQPTVNKYSQINISIILLHASRYLIGAAVCWNCVFQGIEAEVLEKFTKQISEKRPKNSFNPTPR